MHCWTLCCFSLDHTCTVKVLSKVETREGWTLAHVDCWSLINVVPPSFFHTALFSSTLWAKTYLSTRKKEALEGTNGPKKALQKVSLKMSQGLNWNVSLIMSHSKYLSQTLKMSHFKCTNSSCLTHNTSFKMSHSKCLPLIVSFKMSHSKCLPLIVSLKMSPSYRLIQNVSLKKCLT